ncbi:hypothetical protein LIER_21919 [Lithospermum erythrorhizon]|uniref:Uncharacterized protein n=1 Tax=Lithospermum erythrorhizon TaxID=34254 RepID=A0AAV3QS46_LITER
MLVDTGSLTDIIYFNAFDKLNLPRTIIEPVGTPLTGFTGHSVYPLGVVRLWVTMGKGLTSITFQAQFTEVDIPDSSYSGLIGRSILTTMKAIISPVQLKLKFPTAGGVGEMTRVQKHAHIYYQASVPPVNPGVSNQESRRKRRGDNEVNTMTNKEEDNSPREKESLKKLVSHEEVECIPFDEKEKDKTFRVGTKLDKSHTSQLIELIREFADVFARGTEDMPGVQEEKENL